MINKIQIRFPQYDAIRVIAIFFVFCIHSMGIANVTMQNEEIPLCGQILYYSYSALQYAVCL